MICFVFPTGYSDTAFLATFDVNNLIPGDVIIFNYPLQNSGGHYNSETGFYTVPLDGIYEFNFQIFSDGDITIGGYLVVDGEAVSKFVLLLGKMPDLH